MSLAVATVAPVDPFGAQTIMAKMNRVQFQAGMRLTEFVERYGTEEQCEAAVEKSRWPDGFVWRNEALCGLAQGSEDVPVLQLP